MRDPDPRRAARERLRNALRRVEERLSDRFGRRKKRPGMEPGETVPVDPNRPLDLTGGAAAALEFDD